MKSRCSYQILQLLSFDIIIQFQKHKKSMKNNSDSEYEYGENEDFIKNEKPIKKKKKVKYIQSNLVMGGGEKKNALKIAHEKKKDQKKQRKDSWFQKKSILFEQGEKIKNEENLLQKNQKFQGLQNERQGINLFASKEEQLFEQGKKIKNEEKNQNFQGLQNERQGINLFASKAEQLNNLKNRYYNQQQQINRQYADNEIDVRKMLRQQIQILLDIMISDDHVDYPRFIQQTESQPMNTNQKQFEYFFLLQFEQPNCPKVFKDILRNSLKTNVPFNDGLPQNDIDSRLFLVHPNFVRYVRSFLDGYSDYTNVQIQQNSNHKNQSRNGYVCYHRNSFFSAFKQTAPRDRQINLIRQRLPSIVLNNGEIRDDCQYVSTIDNAIRGNIILQTAFNQYLNYMDYNYEWDRKKKLSQKMQKKFKGKSKQKNFTSLFKFSADQLAAFNFNFPYDPNSTTYQWLHLLAKSLGGRTAPGNGIIGGYQFNRIMKIYQTLIKNYIKHRSDLKFKYQVTAYNIKYKPANYNQDDEYVYYGLCASGVRIKIQIIIINQTNPFGLMDVVYNPFQPIQHLKIEQKLVQRLVQYLKGIQFKNLQTGLNSELPEDDEDGEDSEDSEVEDLDEIDIEYIRQKRYAEYLKMKNIFSSNITDGILKLFNQEIQVKVDTNFVEENSKGQSYYKVTIVQVQKFFSRLFNKQIFNIQSQWLPKEIGLSEISLQLKSNLLGIIFNVKTKEIQLPEAMKDFFVQIFHFKNPKLEFEGGFIVFPYFLEQCTCPDFYTLSASIQDFQTPKNQKMGLTYSFKKLGLNFEFFLKDQETNVNWEIISQMILYNLAKNEIELEIDFKVEDNMKILNGRTIMEESQQKQIVDLFGIQGFNVKAIELEINFTSEEIFFMFDIQIEKIDIYFQISYQQSLINFKTFLQDLNIDDIFNIIKQFTKSQISLGHELKIQTIGLQINYKRDTQKFQFDSTVSVTFDQNDFEGQMSYKEQQFKLITKSDQIVIMDIQLKDITLTISKKDKETEIKYSGKLDYKSLGGQLFTIDSEIDLQINKDNKNKYEYSVIAEINLSQQPSLISKLNILNLQKIIFGLQSSQYHSQNGNIKGKYLSIQTGEFSLLNKKTTFSITLNLTNLQFQAAVTFQREKKTGFLQLTKLAFDCKFSDQSVKFQGDFACPIYEDISFAGAVLFQQSKLGIDLKMFGIYRPTSYIQVGYDKSEQDKVTEVKVATNGQLFDLTISGRIKIYDVEASGNFQIVDDVPTHIQMNIQNLNISKMIDFVSQLFNENSKQKKVTAKFDENEQIILKNLYFLYNMNPLDIEGKLLLEFYGNTLEAELKFNTQQIYLKGKFEKPINIGPLYICGKKKGEGAGMQLLLNDLNSRFKLDCSLLIGPFSIDTDLEISKEIIEFSVKVYLFGTQFIGYFKLDYKNQLCMFRLQFSTDQNEQNTQKDKVNHYINDNIINSKQQKFSLKQKPSPNIMMEQQPNIIRNPPSFIKSDEDLFYTAQTHDTRKKLISDYAEKSQVTRKQTQQINSMGEKIFTKQYFTLQKQQQGQFIKQHKQKLKSTEQLKKKVRQLDNYKEFLVKQKGRSLSNDDQNKLEESKTQLKQLKQSKTKILKNIKQNKGLTEISDFQDAIFKKKNNLVLRGFWSDIGNFVINAFHFIAKVATEVVDVTIQVIKTIIPIVIKFLVEGDFHKQQGSWKCGFNLTIQFTFFGTKHSINFPWGDTFQCEQIEHKSIMEMTNYSLAYVKSTYLIPKQIAQKYHNSEQMHQDLVKNKLAGLMHQYWTYQSNMPIQLYTFLRYQNFYFTLSQKPTIMDLNIQKSLQKSSDYKYSFSKKLTYYLESKLYMNAYKPITFNTYFAGANSHPLQTFLRFFEKQDLLKQFSPQQSNEIFNHIPSAQFLKRQEKEIDNKNYSVYSYIDNETKKEMKLCYLDTNATDVSIYVCVKQQIDEPKQGCYWYQLEPIPKTNLQLPQVSASISKKFFS